MDDIDIADCILWHEGLPLPNWDALKIRMVSRFDEDERFDAWTEVARDWLRHLSDATDGTYVFTEMENTLAFGPNDAEVLKPIVRCAESARRSLLSAMPGLAEFHSPGKLVVLAWAGSDAYYRYVSAYHPEDGEFGVSGGMHIRSECPHIALHHVRGDQTAQALAHEMTHASVSHLQLPQWIEEGMAQMFERDHSGIPARTFEPHDVEKNRRYWHKIGLTAFWSGKGFSAMGNVQQYSYELAEILVRLLFADHAPGWFRRNRAAQLRLHAFLRDAKAEDAGQSAALDHLSYGLESLAARFLGDGDWGPRA